MNSEKAKEAGYTSQIKGCGSTKEPIQFNQPPPMAQGPPPAYFVPVQMAPPDYLALSVFSILCCFWPLGIVALLKSTDVRSHVAARRHREAQAASKAARFYNILSIVIGSILTAGVIFVVFILNTAVRALFTDWDDVMYPDYNATTVAP